MTDVTTDLKLDLEGFTLSSYDNVRIGLPPRPRATDDDIDAQLFSYVVSAEKGSGIVSIADLDDTWVQASFEGISTVADLRAAIKRDLEAEAGIGYENFKFQKCMDAIAGRLEGDIPADVVEKVIEASRPSYDERLRALGMTKERYLREQHLTEDEYEEKLREDVRDHLRLNVALDKMIEHVGMVIGADELTDYLATDDPEAFVADIKAAGRVEEAQHAAARVKTMRSIVEGAMVELEGDDV